MIILVTGIVNLAMAIRFEAGSLRRTIGAAPWDEAEEINVKETSSRILASCLIAAGVLTAGSTSRAVDEPQFVRITPEEVQWRAIPGAHGAEMATLQGDSDKPGIYVIRVKFPPHLMDLPHWHPNARYITVLAGTWYTGTGDTFDVSKAVPLKPGSFMMHPAKAAHWDGSAGDETVIVQIIGEGPGTFVPVNPKQPDWIEVNR
jgi:quercetin dioxygenase-like cupin family protein